MPEENVQQQLTALLQKKEWNAEEKRWLLDYMEQTDGAELQHLLRSSFDDERNGIALTGEGLHGRMLRHIHTAIAPTPALTRLKRFWYRAAAVAAVLLLLAGGSYFLPHTAASRGFVTSPLPIKQGRPGRCV